MPLLILIVIAAFFLIDCDNTDNSGTEKQRNQIESVWVSGDNLDLSTRKNIVKTFVSKKVSCPEIVRVKQIESKYEWLVECSYYEKPNKVYQVWSWEAANDIIYLPDGVPY